MCVWTVVLNKLYIYTCMYACLCVFCYCAPIWNYICTYCCIHMYIYALYAAYIRACWWEWKSIFLFWTCHQSWPGGSSSLRGHLPYVCGTWKLRLGVEGSQVKAAESVSFAFEPRFSNPCSRLYQPAPAADRSKLCAWFNEHVKAFCYIAGRKFPRNGPGRPPRTCGASLTEG